MKKIDSIVYNYQGYGTADPREGGHLVRTGNKKICPTLTTKSEVGIKILEIYES